ncbi:MAG: ABC transporter permease [Cyanobacteriota bacterium ELA615]
MKFFSILINSKLFALIIKEIRQILRNRQLIFLLLFPPTMQLLIFGLALSPDVKNLPISVVDYNQTRESWEFVSALKENDIFDFKGYQSDAKTLSQQVRQGNLSIGLIIPEDFQRQIKQDKTAEIQVLIDGVDANSAGIAQGYIKQIINNYNKKISDSHIQPLISNQVIFLYNQGLTSSWFFVPGVIGLVLTLTGILISALTIIKEKDIGTLEQLLMTPAAAWEILLAKIIPLFVLLLGDLLLASALSKLVFHLPFRGNFLVFVLLSSLYIFVCIGLGILLATLVKTQQQISLLSFFFNIPIIQLSGAIAPTESMPIFFKTLSFLDPLRHYIEISRTLILKDVGIESLWPQTIALMIFAILVLSLSIFRFRRQLF